MKILAKDIRHGSVRIKVEGQDDLWHLSSIIDPGDAITGRAERKIKLGDGDSSVKNSLLLTITAEKVEFEQGRKELRILGTTRDENDDVPKGSHQTIEAREGAEITIHKGRWLAYQLKRLDEAASASFSDVLICLADRECALIAVLKSAGYEVLAELSGDVAKKYDGAGKGKEFFPGVAHALSEYATRFGSKRIILASPAFWKEELLKELDPTLQKITRTGTVNTVDRAGIDELLRNPDLTGALREDRAAIEARAMDELLGEIARTGNAAYGDAQVREAASAGAIRTLLVSSHTIDRKRSEGAFDALDAIMREVDRSSGEVLIINGQNEAGKRLEALGGIAALLRYKLSWA